MECVQCGATLREGARFCNQCGAKLAPAAEQNPEEQDTGSSTTGSTGTATAAPPTSGRAKRPPRVPRAEYAGDETLDEATAAPTTTKVSPEQPAAAPVDGKPAETDETVATDAGAETAETTGAASTSESGSGSESETPGEINWEEAETVKRGTIAARGAGRPASEADMPPLDQLTPLEQAPQQEEGAEEPAAASPVDDLSWPLPMSIIVGGRYRVEAIMSTEPEGPDAENVYRARDLQGYERCWSCGTEYGVTGATDQFCRECGADMLARDYVMRERRLADVPAPDTTELGEEGAESAAPEEPVAEGDALTAVPSTEILAAEERAFTQGARSYRVAPLVVEPPAFPRGSRITAAGATDVGKTRPGEHNEDSIGIVVLNLEHDSYARPLALCVVADGLGGHASGQDASRLVVRKLTEYVLRQAALPYIGLPAHTVPAEEGLDDVLREGVRVANVALYGLNRDAGVDMGSTVVAALLFGGTAYIANAGDSRAYVLDDGGLRRITSDHSLVEQLIVSGMIQPEERYTHPQRNQIYRSLGDAPEAQPDIFVQKLRPGMRLLLCSDGLWEMVRDDECAHILRETASVQEACDVLVRVANENGGEDNISVIVIEVAD